MWADTTYAQVAALSIAKVTSPWRTPQGARIGSTLVELEGLAGAPVPFSGFGWDYGGSANWDEGGGRRGHPSAAHPRDRCLRGVRPPLP
ncbi:MAG: hypothetical protein ABL963_11270 [Longimicrobiales bacterium]